VGIRSYFEPVERLLSGDADGVEDECPSDTPSHPCRLDEQVLQLDHAVFDKPGSKSHDFMVIRTDGHPCASLSNAVVREHERLGVGEKMVAVPFI
jgi:hypothetical protein